MSAPVTALSTLTTTILPPLHLLCYSTLLGASLYQTFVMTKITFITLPRTAFTTLQKKVFPLYFRGQCALIFLTAITFPPHGLLSMAQSKSGWIPFAVAASTGLLNLFVYEPRTRRAMIERVHQATRDAMIVQEEDGSEHGTGDAKPSEDMKRLNRVFSKNHAMSIHLNLITIGSVLFHGWILASSLGAKH